MPVRGATTSKVPSGWLVDAPSAAVAVAGTSSARWSSTNVVVTSARGSSGRRQEGGEQRGVGGHALDPQLLHGPRRRVRWPTAGSASGDQAMTFASRESYRALTRPPVQPAPSTLMPGPDGTS